MAPWTEPRPLRKSAPSLATPGWSLSGGEGRREWLASAACGGARDQDVALAAVAHGTQDLLHGYERAPGNDLKSEVESLGADLIKVAECSAAHVPGDGVHPAHLRGDALQRAANAGSVHGVCGIALAACSLGPLLYLAWLGATDATRKPASEKATALEPPRPGPRPTTTDTCESLMSWLPVR
ncbi:MAG: hypothetical protein ACJAZO_003422 [Myxococcota bacterium]|jgi:hypothetical protein